MDYSSPVAAMAVDDTSVTIFNQALPANTIWHFTRRQVSGCGLESADSPPCIIQIDSAGDMIGNTPNPPLNLTIEKQAAAKLKLRWRYTKLAEEIEPTGFYIYIDSGSGFDFATPDAAVAYSAGRSGEFSWTSGSLTNGQLYKLVARSYRTAAGTSQNTSYVSAIADSVGPAAITDLTASWELV